MYVNCVFIHCWENRSMCSQTPISRTKRDNQMIQISKRYQSEGWRSRGTMAGEEKRHKAVLLFSSSTSVLNYWSLAASATMPLLCHPSSYCAHVRPCVALHLVCLRYVHKHIHAPAPLCSSHHRSIETQGELTTLQWCIHHCLFSDGRGVRRDIHVDTAPRGHSGDIEAPYICFIKVHVLSSR